MPNFRQISRTYEDGYGEHIQLIVVSDTYAGIFSGPYIDVNILKVSDIDQQLQDANGSYVEDELSLTISDAEVLSSADVSCINLCKSAINPENKVYLAVFWGSETASIANRRFDGLIQAEYDTDVINWNSNQFSATRSPVNRYKMKVQPTSVALDQIALEDIIAEIDTDWYLANVQNRQAWVRNDSVNTCVADLVSLNHLLRKFADVYEQKILASTGSAISLTYSRCELPGRFIPTRWNRRPDSSKPYYCWSRDLAAASHFPGFEKYRFPYQTFDDEQYILSIDPDAEFDHDWQQIWIDYKAVDKSLFQKEYSDSAANEYRWTNIESFKELLLKISRALNLYLRTEYINDDTINISFVPANLVAKTEIHFADATQAKIKSSNDPSIEDEMSFRADSFYYATGGAKNYKIKTTDGFNSYEPGHKDRNANSDNLLLTISPTTCIFDRALKNPWIDQPAMPHNHSLADANMNVIGKWGNATSAVSLHTAIYMKVPKRVGEDNTANVYWTPAAKYALNIDNEDNTFDDLANYINRNIDLNVKYFKSELELDIPYWNGFSLMPSGTNRSWKNLEIGSILNLEGIEYIVKGITQSCVTPSTKLKLLGKARFDILDPVTVETEETEIEYQEGISFSTNENEYIAAEAINALNILAIRPDGQVEVAKAHRSHFGKIFAIALNSAEIGEIVSVQKSGEIVWDLALEPGTTYFVRNAVGGVNISDGILFEPNANEDMIAIVGIGVAPFVLKIDFTRQVIYENMD